MSKSKDQILLESLYTQVIEEAKKKINPWAVEKALEKKTGKKFSKEKKERIIKGIKKGAKKYGKKITSDKVVKEEHEMDEHQHEARYIHDMSLDEIIDYMNIPDQEAIEIRNKYENLSGESKEAYLDGFRDAAEDYTSDIADHSEV